MNLGQLLLAIFLIVFGLSLLLALAIPGWVIGLLAIVAGILLLAGRQSNGRDILAGVSVRSVRQRHHRLPVGEADPV
jgi:hypothetical protein